MYRCAKFGQISCISRRISTIPTRNQLQDVPAASNPAVRCLASVRLLSRSSPCPVAQDVRFTRPSRDLGSRWSQESRRHNSTKAKSNMNIVNILGLVGTVGMGVLLYKSLGNVNTDITKQDEKVENAVLPSGDKEGSEAAAPAVEPEPLKFPDHVTYLIVGAGTAAMTAVKTIRKNDPTAKILMVTEEAYHPYMRPPLSKELWFEGSDPNNLIFKDWAGKEKTIFYNSEEFYMKPELLPGAENGGTAIAYRKRVQKLDVVAQKAYCQDGDVIQYDKCLLATGGKPKNAPVFDKLTGEAKKRIHLFRNIEDFQRLYRASDKAKTVVVVGGGFLGSELSVALAQRAKGKDLAVIQIFPEKGNMGKVFPEYLSKWTLEKVSNEGVTVHPKNFVVSCDYNKHHNQMELILNTGEKLMADEIVVAVGLQPNVDLAQSSGLELDPFHGGFLVNAELEARKNLWVAGDAACFYDITLGRRRVEHHDHAVVSGRLAGDNMTGQTKPYTHQSMFWSDLGPSVGYEAIGICDSSLPTFSVFAKATSKDTPKAVVEETGEGLRSETETKQEASGSVADVELPHAPVAGEDYGKGVIFYTRDNKIVGIILWNLFGRMPIARQVLKEGKVDEDLAEVARLFDVHDQKKTAEQSDK